MRYMNISDHLMILLCSAAGFVCTVCYCVRLSRLVVGFRTHFKSLHFHSLHTAQTDRQTDRQTDTQTDANNDNTCFLPFS